MEYLGKVTGGVVVLENGKSLPEGTQVRVAPLNASPLGEETLGQRLLRFAGLVKGLPSDMAQHHDHYLSSLCVERALRRP